MGRSQKKRKRLGLSDRVVRKKGIASAVSSNASEASNNPFERRTVRKKHHVVGERSKLSQPSAPLRSDAMTQRKATLGEEYERESKGKSGGVVDLRKGATEQAAHRRIMKRAMLKRDKFSLNDDDGATLASSLGKEGTGPPLNGTPEVRKTKREIYAEIIKKSKDAKVKRSMAREEDMDKTEDLDNEFRTIRSLLDIRKNPLPDPQESEKDDFDLVLSKLRAEESGRGKASDKAVSSDEKARQEQLRLEKLERARLKRMAAKDNDMEDELAALASDDEMSDEDESTSSSHKTFDTAGPVSGDALVDDYAGFTLDDVGGSDDDDDDGDEELVMMDVADDDGVEVDLEKLDQADQEQVKKAVAQGEEGIPFLIDIPERYSEFRAMLQGRDAVSMATVVNRMYKGNHPSLAPENSTKIQHLFVLLLQHFQHLSGLDREVAKLHTQRENCGKHLDALSSAMYHLTQQMPSFAVKIFKKKLSTMRGMLWPPEDPSSRYPAAHGIVGWRPGDFLLFQLITRLFPTSDFKHNVTSPAMLLMAQYLGQWPILGLEVVVSKLFVCSLLHNYVVESHRFIPEAMEFLTSLLVSATFGRDAAATWDSPSVMQLTSVWEADAKRAATKAKRIMKKDKIAEVPPIPVMTILSRSELSDHLNTDLLRVQIVKTALRTLRLYIGTWRALPCFDLIFEPYVNPLERLIAASNPEDVSELLKECVGEIMRTSTRAKRGRRPLQLQKHRAIPIPSLQPKILDPEGKDAKKEEVKKLKREIKKETKFAMRELRKDNMFLAHERARKRAREEEEKEGSRKRIMNMLEGEQHMMKEVDKLYEREKKMKRG